MQEFRKLDIWKRAHELVLAVYRASQDLPKGEVFGITIQLRRAATAIPTRIAEGCSREASSEFIADLRKSVAASNELDYLLLLAKDLGYLKPGIYDSLNAETVEVRKMIYGLLRKL
ncbi:MAG TPA: four helix bundle protein [Acidobacteriaceae bacterium]|nr:four helix bundle protein [Acidobacteriaceae bacterium]